MGPDEYHYPVNNSVYMNTIAKISLLLPSYIKRSFNVSGGEPLQKWADDAEKIYVLFDNVNNYHPEYEGYQMGEKKLRRLSQFLDSRGSDQASRRDPTRISINGFNGSSSSSQ